VELSFFIILSKQRLKICYYNGYSANCQKSGDAVLSMFFFSIQNAFQKKSVAALAILGVAFGTALMTILFSLVGGMERRAEKTFSELSNKIMITGRDAIFGGLFLGMGTGAIPSNYIENIKGIPHVERVYTQVSAIMRPRDINYVIPLYGYKNEDIKGLSLIPHNKIIEGRTPENDREVILGKSLGEYMKLLNSPYQVGKAYSFNIPSGGKTRDLELIMVGIYQTGNEVMDGALVGSEKLAREITNIPPAQVSGINVIIDGVNNVEQVARAIQSALSGKTPEVQVLVPGEVLNPVKNVIDLFGNFLITVAVVAAAAGGLSIMVVMLLSVVSRMREFGILKALGWTPANIMLMVLVESLVLSLSGAALGTLLGYGGLLLAGKFISPDIAVLTWQVTSAVALAGVIIGVAGGIYPAWRANRASPSSILREI